MPAPPDAETCAQCAFDGDRWTDQDATRTLRHAGDLVRFAVEGCEADLTHRRPDAETWSIVEYVDHLREVVFANHFVAASAVESPGIDLGSAGQKPMAADPPAPAELGLDDAIDALGDEGMAFAEMLASTGLEAWSDTAVVGGDPHWSVAWCARHACHDLFHHLMDIADIRASLGGPVAMEGSLCSVHASDGGVPKPTVDQADVDAGGVVGDRQNTRLHHGRPWQALCLWSSDVVAALRSEGNPIEPGAAGENISIAGLDWSRVRAGLVVRIGDMRCRISAPAVPCHKNDRWFADGSSQRIAHDRHPGWSRWYASVLSPGHIAPGDAVTVTSS